jgi:hypothetical protein
MSFTQAPAGSTLNANSINSGTVFARNEADTTASTSLVAGPIYTKVGNGTLWGTDANGRYKYANPDLTGSAVGSYERWNNLSFGPEWSAMLVLQHTPNGSTQNPFDSDDSVIRKFQLQVQNDGTASFILFNTSSGVGGSINSTNKVSQTAPSVLTFRIRYDSTAGAYKLGMMLDGEAAAEVAFTGTPVSLATGDYVAITARNGGPNQFAGRLYQEQLWNRSLTDPEFSALATNPTVGYGASGGTGGTTVNETGAPSTQGNTSSTGAATVTPAGSSGATVTSGPFKGFGGIAQAGLTVPNVMLIKLDRTVVVSRANQVTNGSGQLVITDPALVAGTDYMLATFDATGVFRGMKKFTAA